MATRRIVATEKTMLDQDETVDEKSNISPAVPRCDHRLLSFPLFFHANSQANPMQNYPAMSSSSSLPSPLP